jgi:hypothetical protein
MKRRWISFMTANPFIFDLFEMTALDKISKGAKRLSARAIWHEMKDLLADTFIDPGQEPTKLNEHFTPNCSRLFMLRNPEHQVFELRHRPTTRQPAIYNEDGTDYIAPIDYTPPEEVDERETTLGLIEWDMNRNNGQDRTMTPHEKEVVHCCNICLSENLEVAEDKADGWMDVECMNCGEVMEVPPFQ